MSNISTVYDKLIEVVAALFTGKSRIPNPYDLTNNSETMLRDSWGIKMSPSSKSGIDLGAFHSESREFSIVLCRRVDKLREDSTAMDAPIKAMAEDHKTLMVRLLKNDQLGIPDSVGKIEFMSSSGVEFTKSEKTTNISTESKFSVDIMEGL